MNRIYSALVSYVVLGLMAQASPAQDRMAHQTPADKRGDRAQTNGEFAQALRGSRGASDQHINELGEGPRRETAHAAGGFHRRQPPDSQKISARLSRLDTDHDGKLMPEEFAARTKKRFGAIDTNHDGAIDSAEINHYSQELARKMQKMRQKRTAKAGIGHECSSANPKKSSRLEAIRSELSRSEKLRESL